MTIDPNRIAAIAAENGMQADAERLLACSPYFCDLLRDVGEAELRALMQPLASAALPGGSEAWRIDSEGGIEQCLSRLRRHRRRAMRHILWWELGVQGDILASAAALAQLADSMLAAALSMGEQLLAPRFGHIEGGRFCVIGLGKLGGQELNFGSDLDPLFIWDAPAGSETLGGRSSIEAKEYYAHLSRLLIRLFSEHSAEGIAWPIDMRLRPGGDSGPICLSLAATLDAYREYGQTWERAMLLKARPSAGALDLGREFVAGITPFVYRRYLDYTTVQALAEMKRRIDARAGNLGIGAGFDVKRGRGGIREIEFFIQSLQLLHGGRNEALRPTGSMPALAALVAAGIVEADAAAELAESYRFWRRIEHALQARHGAQTHLLPPDYADYLHRALLLPSPDMAMVAAAAPVQRHFEEQFAEVATSGELTHWLQLPAEEVERRLPFFPEEERQRAVAALGAIAAQLGRGLLPDRSRGKVERILALAMAEWDHDANGVQALECFGELILRIGGRATWIDLLSSHEGVLRWLIGALSASRYLANHLVRDPSWLEWSLDRAQGEGRIAALLGGLNRLDADKLDEEQFLADLARLIDQGRITAAMAAAEDGDPLLIGGWLADLADAATEASLRLALARFALPADFPLVALALGKHGSRAMGLVSDLDMVFVLAHPDPESEGKGGRSQRDWAQRVGRRMIQYLSQKPPFGAGFEFDARLRPSGDSGVLVTTLAAFRDYQLNSAQPWEHQVLCRARAVCGPAAARGEVMAAIDEILRLPRDYRQLAAEVVAMRQKMVEHLASQSSDTINIKQDPGGLVDIEFLAQYARLAFGGRHTGTAETLRNLPAGAPTAWLAAAPLLADTFVAYRSMENALRVQLWASVGRLPASDGASEWETLRRHAPIKSVEALRQRMNEVRARFLALLHN